MRCCLLVFGPQPRGDRFFDVGEGVLFVFALRYTAGQSRAFSDDPAIFGLGERDVKYHAHILPIAARCYNTASG